VLRKLIGLNWLANGVALTLGIRTCKALTKRGGGLALLQHGVEAIRHGQTNIPEDSFVEFIANAVQPRTPAWVGGLHRPLEIRHIDGRYMRSLPEPEMVGSPRRKSYRPPAVTNIITVHICSYTRRELRPVVFIETVQVNTNTGKQPQFSLGQYISTQIQLNNSSSK
jgi:hypothetical protein